MLIVKNSGNWEMSERTSKKYPEPRIDGGTLFLPVNITETTLPEYTHDEEGEVVSSVEVAAYHFEEYRINKAEDLPDGAAAALAEAFQISAAALKILGVM